MMITLLLLYIFLFIQFLMCADGHWVVRYTFIVHRIQEDARFLSCSRFKIRQYVLKALYALDLYDQDAFKTVCYRCSAILTAVGVVIWRVWRSISEGGFSP